MSYIQLAYGRRMTNPPYPQQIDWKDLALDCSRIHRFANQLPKDVTWTVAHHHVAAYTVGCALYPDVDEFHRHAAHANRIHWAIRKTLAIHDAHEGILGDTPTPFKTPERRALEETFDRSAIYPAAGLDPDNRADPRVKYVDRLCCAAEAITFLGMRRWELDSWGLQLEGPAVETDLNLALHETRIIHHEVWVKDPTGLERYMAVLHRVGLV